MAQRKVPSVEALEKLSESMDLMEDLIDNAYYGMVLVDKDGKIIKWNYEKLFGLKESQVVGRPVNEIIENTRLHIVAKSGKKELFELQEINGKHVITSRVPIIKDGQVIGAVGTVLFRDTEELQRLASQVQELEKKVTSFSIFTFDEIIGVSEEMKTLKKVAKRIANTKSTVLIQGESGTGKELFAQAIHHESGERGNFVPINCGAIPKDLLESELFGYETGAFTGAKKGGKEGKLALAKKGTLFLDEVGSMPLELQSKLLRVLESREYERLGGTGRHRFQGRIISAANESLERAVDRGRFRRDLYYRLNVVRIEIPPLRERKMDILPLAEELLKKLSPSFGEKKACLSVGMIHALKKYDWPGNVRELRNVLERAMIFSETEELTEELLPGTMNFSVREVAENEQQPKFLKDRLKIMEKELILEAIEKCGGNKSLAAKKLGIHRTLLYRKLKERQHQL